MSTSSETPGVLPLLPEVKASEQEVRAIVDAIPHAISVFSPDGAVLYVNRAFLEFTGFTLDDVTASDFRARFYHPEDFDRVRDERARALPRGMPFDTEQRVRRKDGQRVLEHDALHLRRAPSPGGFLIPIGLGTTLRAAAGGKGNQLSAQNPPRSHEARPHGNRTDMEFIGNLQGALVRENALDDLRQGSRKLGQHRAVNGKH